MVSVMDIMQLCRLCLVKDQVNIPIFEEQGDVRQIFLKITACLPVKVSRDDNLPKKICDGCLYKLELLYQFWNTTANAEKQLLSWLSQAGIEPNTKTTDKAMEIVAQSHAHPHSDEVKNQIILKQEAVDPESRGDVNDSISLETNYVMQQQQLPYETFTFEQSGYEAETSLAESSGLIENEVVDEPAIKRRRRSVKAVPIVQQESDDENIDDVETMEITKTEEDSEEEVIDDNIEPTSFVGISNTDNEQPGPSGVGKTSTEAPKLEEETVIDFISKTENENSPRDSNSPIPTMIDERNSRVMFLCDHCGKKFWARSTLTLHKKMHKNGDPYQCDICAKVYTTNCTLFKHKRAEHGEVILYSCEFCDKIFHIRYHLLKHVRTIHINNKERCEICHQVFKTKFNLAAHIAMKHQGGIMECKMCNLKFSKLSQQKRHIDTVHLGINHRCTICNKTFNSREALKEHSIMHDPGAPIFKCDPCKKIFRTPRTYKKHQERIHEKRTFICEKCGKVIKSSISLKEHMMIHTGEKPFVCAICGKRFHKRSLLRIHNRIHTKEKPYKCEECHKCFSQRTSLVIHIRIAHTGEKPYACHLCQGKYATKTLLNTHIKKSHGTSLKDVVTNNLVV